MSKDKEPQELQFTIVPRNVLPTYSELFRPLFEKLEALSAQSALKVEVPKGKKPLSFRNSLMNAAKKRGLHVSTSNGPDESSVYIWITAGVRKRE